MAIARWAGRTRKYVETSVHLKEKEVLSTISNYTDMYMKQKMDLGSTIKAIQLSLNLYFDERINFRTLINSMLSKVKEDSEHQEDIIENFLVGCQTK